MKSKIKYIASNSNGKDSLFMILELIRRDYPLDLVLFFDGGKEFKAILAIWERVKNILDEKGIRWDVVTPRYAFDYCFSEIEVNTKNGEDKKGYSWCGGVCRWMTALKTAAIKGYYKKYFPDDIIVEYVGIASDELGRVKAPVKNSNQIKMYPLINWGYTENDCFVGCYKAGFDWTEPGTDVELYQILDRVSCWCCGNKNLDELRNIYHYLPEYWKALKEMQKKTDIPFKKQGTVFELEERFRKEDEELEKKKSNTFRQITMFDNVIRKQED